MTTETAPQPTIYEQLRQLAREYAERAEQAPTFAQSDIWHTDAAQLRLVAQMVGDRPLDDWSEIGQQWVDAARKVLDAYKPGDPR
ncbi:hypothetical protein [Microbacterium sp. NPDC087665]|uniref:hypothetical protein n=1 Tax=Microbacterium sp. NPDC087665 TaxID=3364194 RepID=UPI0038110196